jgi:hypothetical protein
MGKEEHTTQDHMYKSHKIGKSWYFEEHNGGSGAGVWEVKVRVLKQIL